MRKTFAKVYVSINMQAINDKARPSGKRSEEKAAARIYAIEDDTVAGHNQGW